MIECKIEVQIDDIRVNRWYYSFDYVITMDGNEVAEDRYESDHAWQEDQEGFVAHLENGGAVKTALEQL